MATMKHIISDSEILAQTKNRYEETMLSVRIRSIKMKEAQEEDSLKRTQKQLIASMKKSLRTSGSSPDPEIYGEVVTRVNTTCYQKPWAYAFSETTHNAVYKETTQQPRRLPLRQKSAPLCKTRYDSNAIGKRSVSASGVSNASENIEYLHSTNTTSCLRPQSCALPHSTGDKLQSVIRFHQPLRRPQTCQSKVTFNDQYQTIDRTGKQSRILNKSDRHPIVDVKKSVNTHDGQAINYVTRFIGNAGKVSRYDYQHHRSIETSPYVWFRGRKIRNYVKPQDRYKKDALNVMKREKLMLKLSTSDSDSLEESRKSALKAGEAFPKAVRLRVLNHLIESNIPKSDDKCIDDNAKLNDRIEEFLRSIDEFCESRSASTKSLH